MHLLMGSSPCCTEYDLFQRSLVICGHKAAPFYIDNESMRLPQISPSSLAPNRDRHRGRARCNGLLEPREELRLSFRFVNLLLNFEG
jgi:hypothetical protein